MSVALITLIYFNTRIVLVWHQSGVVNMEDLHTDRDKAHLQSSQLLRTQKWNDPVSGAGGPKCMHIS